MQVMTEDFISTGIFTFDKVGATAGASDTIFTSATPTEAGETAFGLGVVNSTAIQTPTPEEANWSPVTLAGTNTQYVGFFTKPLPTATFTSFTDHLSGPQEWAVMMQLFKSTPPGFFPNIVQQKSIASGTLAGFPLVSIGSFDVDVTAGNAIFVILTYSNAAGTGFFGTIGISDDRGNTYTALRNEDSGTGIIWWTATNAAAGPTTITVTTNPGTVPGVAGGNIAILEVSAIS
jgi:hypothetical protein